jgi:hypothetical protein
MTIVELPTAKSREAVAGMRHNICPKIALQDCS